MNVGSNYWETTKIFLSILLLLYRIMRHRVRKHLKFNNKSFQHRKAMQRNLLTSFFLHKRITTTQKRAQSIVALIDKLINVANTDSQQNAIRCIMQYVFTKEASRVGQ